MFWWDMHACLHKEVQSVPKQQTQKKHKLSEQWVQTWGILQRTMVYSFIYSTSYQTENSTLAANSKGQHCMFFHSRRCVLPERSWEVCSLALPLALSPLSTKQKLIGNQNLCKVHRFRGEGRGEAGGPMWADWKTISPINWPRIWFEDISTWQWTGRKVLRPGLTTGWRGEWTNDAGLHQREDWESYQGSLPGHYNRDRGLPEAWFLIFRINFPSKTW